jgi:hypothetical protein
MVLIFRWFVQVDIYGAVYFGGIVNRKNRW